MRVQNGSQRSGSKIYSLRSLIKINKIADHKYLTSKKVCKLFRVLEIYCLKFRLFRDKNYFTIITGVFISELVLFKCPPKKFRSLN